MIDEAVRQEIERLEGLRCEALMAGNVGTLGGLMADDLVHIHGTGDIEDKATYLLGVQDKYCFHRVERGALQMRAYGDVVVVNGPLRQTISLRGTNQRRDVDAVVTQLWIRVEDGWRQNTCHNAFLAKP